MSIKDFKPDFLKDGEDKTNRHNAIAKCVCGGYVISTGGGRFISCPCGESYVDQERFGGRHVRIGGDAEFLEQICPENCEYPELHKGNKKIDKFGELKSYLRETYQIEL